MRLAVQRKKLVGLQPFTFFHLLAVSRAPCHDRFYMARAMRKTRSPGDVFANCSQKGPAVWCSAQVSEISSNLLPVADS